MANDNTILAVLGATAAAATTNAQAFLNSAGNAISIAIPANYNFNCRPFLVRMVGTVTNLNATSVVMTPIIAIGTASTYASNAAFCSTSAGISTNLASQLSANFLLEMEGLWDSTTNTVNGQYTIVAGPTGAVVAPTACTSVTGVTQGNGGSTGLNFIPFFKFSASSTNQLATLVEFSIEQI